MKNTRLYNIKKVAEVLDIKISCNDSDTSKELEIIKSMTNMISHENIIIAGKSFGIYHIETLSGEFIAGHILQDNKEVYFCDDAEIWTSTLKNFNL